MGRLKYVLKILGNWFLGIFKAALGGHVILTILLIPSALILYISGVDFSQPMLANSYFILFWSPFFLVYYVSANYDILSNLNGIAVCPKKRKKVILFTTYIVLGIFFLLASLFFDLIRLAIIQNFPQFRSSELTIPFIISLYFGGTAFAFFRLAYELTEYFRRKKERKPLILFLRKFDNNTDQIVPLLISGIAGKNFRLVALDSPYSGKTFRYLVTCVSIIPFYKRFIHPFSYSVEFLNSSDQTWLTDVKRLINQASYIVIDITKMSDYLRQEIDIVIQYEKKDSTLFTYFASPKDQEPESLEFLKEKHIDIAKRVIRVPYKRSRFEYIGQKRKLRKNISLVLGLKKRKKTEIASR